MLLHLHPTRREALIVGETTLTRWLLTEDTPFKLCEVSTAPHLLQDFTILQDGRIVIVGDVTSVLNEELFALNITVAQSDTDPCTIELRSWDDLSLVKTFSIPQTFGPLVSMAASPDGHWLVIATGYPERLFLLDWHNAQIVSHHALWGNLTSGLAFDPTSTFVAGISSHENWGHLMLWQLTPTERWLPQMEGRPSPLIQEPDEICGPYALSPKYWALDRTGISWPQYDLAATMGKVVFSPKGNSVVFRLISFYNTPFIDFVAYDVSTGQQRWRIRRESNDGLGECFVFTPDGHHLLICGRDNFLSIYRDSDGMFISRFPCGVRERIEAMTFDHNGKALWFATKNGLLQYQVDDEILGKRYE